MPDWVLRGPVPPEAATGERAFVTERLNDPAHPAASLARARVAPGVTTQLHALTGITEIYLIRAGSGLVEVGEVSALVEAGDRVVIPPGTPQRITNTGARDLMFDCLCTPRFVPEAYVAIDS